MVNVDIITKLLTPNKYSRPQIKLNSKIKGIVVHWTASPQGRNQGVWNYFERRKSGKTGYGSAHFIVDLDGAIWNCIPTNEMAYHVGSTTYTANAKKLLGTYPNDCTIGIEFCILDNRGKMNELTWQKGAKLVAYLLEKFNLNIDNIWTHQEVVGWKDCHRYFVENPNEYKRFKNDVSNYLKKQETNPTTPTNTTIPTVDNKYQIQAGDTLWGIARKFNTTVVQLKDLNPTVDVYSLKIGDFIIIKEEEKPKNLTDVLPTSTLSMGDKGEDVKKLQNALNKLNFNVGYADGIFGLATKDGLKRYQSMYENLVNDGVYGNSTREQMLKDLLK